MNGSISSSPAAVKFSRLAFAAAIVAGLSACRAPLPGAAREAEELRAVEETRIIALQQDDQLLLRFRLKGRDAYAVAPLPATTADPLTAMEFSRGARDAFAAAKKSVAPLTVLSAGAWRTLSRTVAAELAPASPRHGTVVTAGGRELVVCRDAAGTPVFMPLTQRPKGLKIIRRLSAGEIVPRLAAAFTRLHPHAGTALILTGREPAMLLLDPRAPRLTFVSAPPEQTLKLPILGSSPDVTVRGLLSVGLRSGALATLKNPVTTAFHGSANLISMADAALHGVLSTLPAGPPPPVAQRAPMDIDAWEQHLDKLCGDSRLPSAVKLRIGGDQFFPDLIEAIQEARESIDIMLYIFDTDDYAIQIADLLKKRSHEVRIRVMIDEAASYQSSLMAPQSPQAAGHHAPSSIVDYLRHGSKIEVRPMAMPALSATHTKMIVIDGTRAWLGGMNIGREYRCDWHDMMVEVNGPLIGWMQQSFGRSWAHNGWLGDLGELIASTRTSKSAATKIPPPPGSIPVRPLRSSAIHSDLRRAQFAALRQARREIWIQNAYITDSRFIAELIAARYRGVDVRVILPKENDSPLMKANNKALIPQLLRHGVRVWVLPEMSHVKAALYDGWACTGSSNYDRLSFRVNQEFNIGYSDPAAVGALRRDLFLRDMARGEELSAPPPSSIASQFTANLMQLLAGQF